MRGDGLLPVRVGRVSDAGMVRPNNEDALGAALLRTAEAGPAQLRGIFIVADGMGGHAHGEVASRLAVDTVLARLKPGGEPVPSAAALASLMADVFREANESIRNAGARGGSPEEGAMGTTLTAAALVGNSLTIAHVGDSRAYLARRDEILQLTDDHAWAAEQMRQGTITAAASENHPLRHYLTRSLGGADEVKADLILDRPLQDGDVLVLCSDGLTAHLTADEILACLHGTPSPQRAAEGMVALAKSRGGSDNVTVVVAEFGRFSRWPAVAAGLDLERFFQRRPPASRTAALVMAGLLMGAALLGGLFLYKSWPIWTDRGSVSPSPAMPGEGKR